MIKKILLVLFGAGVGSGVTYMIMKDKYERSLQKERQNMLDEINEFKLNEYIENDVSETKKASEYLNKDPYDENKLLEEVKEQQKETSKLVESNVDKTISDVKNIMDSYDNKDKPYIISAEEFDTKGYDLRYWYLYNDDVLVDEANEVVSQVELEFSIGDCLLTDFDGDVIHIRNDYDQTDYEIKRVDEDFIEEIDE